MRRTCSASPPRWAESRLATERISSCSTRPTGGISRITWAPISSPSWWRPARSRGSDSQPRPSQTGRARLASMPSRKQRRRRAKERRHDYEYVYVDDAGQEIEPPPEDKAGPDRARGKSNANGGKARRGKAAGPIRQAK